MSNNMAMKCTKVLNLAAVCALTYVVVKIITLPFLFNVEKLY